MTQTVTITHLGDGMLEFEIPSFIQKNQIRISPKMMKTAAPENFGSYDTLYFDLLEIGSRLLRKNGTFYVALLKDGFIQNGGITLIGTVSAPDNKPVLQSIPCIRSLVQLDGDITCKLDQRVIKMQNMRGIVTNFSKIQEAIFKDFRTINRALILGLTSLIAAQLSIVFLLVKIARLIF